MFSFRLVVFNNAYKPLLHSDRLSVSVYRCIAVFAWFCIHFLDDRLEPAHQRRCTQHALIAIAFYYYFLHDAHAANTLHINTIKRSEFVIVFARKVNLQNKRLEISFALHPFVTTKRSNLPEIKIKTKTKQTMREREREHPQQQQQQKSRNV